MNAKNRAILKLWNLRHLPLNEIGRRFSLSRERIRQVIAEAILEGESVLSFTEWERKRIEARRVALEMFRKSCKWDFPPHLTHRPALFRTSLRKIGIGSECELCGFKAEPRILNRHHIDKNRKNNHPTNIIILCPNCHALVHLHKGDLNTNFGGVRMKGPNVEQNRYMKAHRHKQKAA